MAKDSVLLRLKQIIGDRKSNPPIEPIIPISRSAWWKGVREKRYPAPLKLSARTTVWRAEDIRKLIERVSIQGGASCQQR